ncbi:MAG: DsrE family protein [Peptococcaceae bacterium]|nr:DsrE family protein [Peptococcaceae bacterium]
MSNAQPQGIGGSQSSDRLLVLWTSGDREVALKMAFMYTLNAKTRGWWGTVQLLVWGPSAILLAQDTELQDYVQRMKEAGVQLMACKACSDSYGVSDSIAALGVEVVYAGEPLTTFLKDGWHVVSV